MAMTAKTVGGKVKSTKKKESTKDRIILKSLGLFNSRGERNVTTNHIAAELGISPGNLYYHFKNKQEIIFELFLRYQAELEHVLRLPEDGTMTFAVKTQYFEGLFQAMWEYRFLHRDLVHLLEVDDKLQQSYADFVARAMIQACAIYERLVKEGMIVATGEQIKTLVLNIWVLCSSWASFLSTALPNSKKEGDLSKEMLKRGIYQIICMEEPYMSDLTRKEHLPDLIKEYRVGGNWPLPIDLDF